jgi:hypothetical protein
MREVPFVRKADNLTLATSHLAQSSSASRVIAAQAGFFILILAGFYSRRQLLAKACHGGHSGRLVTTYVQRAGYAP